MTSIHFCCGQSVVVYRNWKENRWALVSQVEKLLILVCCPAAYHNLNSCWWVLSYLGCWNHRICGVPDWCRARYAPHIWQRGPYLTPIFLGRFRVGGRASSHILQTTSEVWQLWRSTAGCAAVLPGSSDRLHCGKYENPDYFQGLWQSWYLLLQHS